MKRFLSALFIVFSFNFATAQEAQMATPLEGAWGLKYNGYDFTILVEQNQTTGTVICSDEVTVLTATVNSSYTNREISFHDSLVIGDENCGATIEPITIKYRIIGKKLWATAPGVPAPIIFSRR